MNLKPLRYGFPNPQHPCYHLILLLESELASDLNVRQVRVDGARVRDFWVYNDGIVNATNTFTASQRGNIVIRVNWANDSSHHVEVDLDDAAGKAHTLSADSTAPHYGGYWNPAWRYYAATVVKEDRGLAREKEPVHLLLGVYADRITAPEREVRVVSVHPASGISQEIPSQVYAVSTQSAVQTEKGQPTTTFSVAFFADVPANEARVYLVFYGNPNAPVPAYSSDLVVSGNGLALTIENSHYRIKLHPKSGAVDEILLKQGINAVFDHHIETNGALLWNPDLYAPPRVWTHASDWDPPANCTTISGPIFCMTKRWGALPAYPDTECSVTYVFYAHQPYMLMDSTLDILQDMDVRALRNGEIVVNLNVVREFAWKQPDGNVQVIDFKQRPREPKRALDLPVDTPWWAFIHRDLHCSLAALTLQTAAVRRHAGLVNLESCVILKWGPWVYCTRPLIQTNNTANPQRLVRVPASSSFSESMAILPSRLGATDQDCFDSVESVYARLAKPLRVSPSELDMDARTPEAWGPTFPAPESRL
jgi:hypothetical protein